MNWLFDGNHGKCVLGNPTAEVIGFVKDRVKRTVVEVDGARYRFRAFTMIELPTMVTLTFKLPYKGMIPEQNTMEEAINLMAIVAADNEWPTDETGQHDIVIVTVKWVREVNQGKPTEDGYWLIRFRVDQEVARHIRTINEGEISVNSMMVTVFHKRGPWKGDRRPELVHADAPATA